MINKLRSIKEQDIPKTNPTLKSYFSLSTNEKNASNAFDTNAIAGQLVGSQLNKQLSPNFNEIQFIQEVLEEFKFIMSTEEAIEIIQEIYFPENKLPIFAPLMYMSHPYKSLDAKTKKSLEIFLQMMQVSKISVSSQNNLNFLEQHIYTQFEKYVDSKIKTSTSNSYTHYLEKFFTKDFNYLLSNPQTFKNNIDTFLKFYLFTYSAQLTLNVQTNTLEKPTLKPLYFILNHEQASIERKSLGRYGYKTLIEKTRYLFPYLSLLEFLSNITEQKDLKLFDLANIEDTPENIYVIDNITKMFRHARSLSVSGLITSTTIDDALKNLFNTAFEQFKGDKKAVIDRFISAYEKQISSPFIQSRGRSGKVLVFDQDTMLLLTNISIGINEKLRFQDLLIEFKNRGVFFDPKSEDTLLELYERVGNIERKSDSGDAVYVRAI
jgi:DNA phosphorothioation-dependent restriction protein DptG